MTLIELDDELGSIGIDMTGKVSGPDFGFIMDQNNDDYTDFDPVSFINAGYTHYYQDPGDPSVYFFFTQREYRKILKNR